MKIRDRYLSGILLVLIGVMIGMLIAYYQQKKVPNDLADVKVTQIKHSNEPIFSDKQLAKMDERFLFKKIAERAIPAVVYIEALVPFTHGEMPDDEYHDKKDGFWNKMLPKRARAVGSGVLISSDGYILTNNHVVDEADSDGIEVVLNDKRTFNARLVGQDPTTDLAIIKIDGKNFPAMTIGNSDKVKVGEWVLAIGNPFRLRSTVTAGIISALGRNMQIINDRMRVENFIQTDAAINKGNSGGALVNTSGELVGVNTAIASQTGNYEGYGFAVPSNLAGKVAKDLVEFGDVHRALLGVSIISINAHLADELGMDAIRGVQITGISQGGAADQSGLKPYDVILSVNGFDVNQSNQLQQKIAVRHPGEIVDLEIWRAGRKLEKRVKLGKLHRDSAELALAEKGNGDHKYNEDRPQFRSVTFAHFDLGIQVMAVSKGNDLEVQDLMIAKIDEGSEAEKKGLKKGLRINKVNNNKIKKLDDLKDVITKSLEQNNAVSLEVETDTGEQKVVRLEK